MAEDAVEVGAPLPRLASIEPADGFVVRVSWAEGTRVGRIDEVDLSPIIMRFALYRSLRENPALFATARLRDSGSAVEWGHEAERDELDMSAVTIERLAGEIMTNEEFRAFLRRNQLTFDAAAAALGLSRRQVAYFSRDKPIPRTVALACRGWEAGRRAA